jgi:hypothetical protein
VNGEWLVVRRNEEKREATILKKGAQVYNKCMRPIILFAALLVSHERGEAAVEVDRRVNTVSCYRKRRLIR